MSAVPQPGPRRVRRRRRHGGALLAALAYGVAAFTVYQLVVPSLGSHSEPATGVDEAVAASPGTADLGTAAPREVLALRAVASRVQQSVYTVRVGGATRGSAFVGWLYRGKVSFVLTARDAVAGAETGQLVLRRGGQSLPARVVRADPANGLALLRVNAALDRPLWEQAGERAPLKRDARAVIVPAGTSGAFGDGTLSKRAHSFSLLVGGGQRYLGAPVLADGGELAGIVVAHLASGESRIVSLADVCRRMRPCG